MTILLFENQAQTTLAAPITAISTTTLLAWGSGAHFPHPLSGEAFKLTFIHATNNLITEICLVTNVTGDVFTIVRGQEATTPRAWAIGTFATNLMTAGTAGAFPQLDGLNTGLYSPVFENMQTNTGQVLSVPVNANDLVNKVYVDSVSSSQFKAECQCATTEHIPLTGLQTIDGYTTLPGDRVLAKNQINTAVNGIWIAAAGNWLRATDMEVWAQVPGAFTFVQNGDVYLGTGWVAIATQTGTINVTPISWAQFSSYGAYTAGNGLQLIGNQFSLVDSPTIAGTLTAAAVTITTGTISSAPVVNTDIANKLYVDSFNSIAGYPVVMSDLKFRDVVMFGVNEWVNINQTEITDGGNY